MVMDKSWDNVFKPVIGKIDGFSALVAPYFDEEKTVMKLESFVIGIAVWFLILCAISTIINGLWRQLGILAILFLCIIAFMFAEVLLSSLIEDLCDGLRRI